MPGHKVQIAAKQNENIYNSSGHRHQSSHLNSSRFNIPHSLENAVTGETSHWMGGRKNIGGRF